MPGHTFLIEAAVQAKLLQASTKHASVWARCTNKTPAKFSAVHFPPQNPTPKSDNSCPHSTTANQSRNSRTLLHCRHCRPSQVGAAVSWVNDSKLFPPKQPRVQHTQSGTPMAMNLYKLPCTCHCMPPTYVLHASKPWRKLHTAQAIKLFQAVAQHAKATAIQPEALAAYASRHNPGSRPSTKMDGLHTLLPCMHKPQQAQ